MTVLPYLMARRRLASAVVADPYQQILDLATADGWAAVYDPTNPNTRTLRVDGADSYFSEIADGLGNLLAVTQATAASQPSLSVGEFGDLDAMVADGTSFIRQATDSFQFTQPMSIVGVCQFTTSNFEGIFTSELAQAKLHRGFGRWYYAAGVSNNSGVTTGLNKTTFACTFNGASSILRQNAQQIHTGNAGNQAPRKLGFLAESFAGANSFTGPLGPFLIRDDGDAAAIARMEDLLHDLTGIAKA